MLITDLQFKKVDSETCKSKKYLDKDYVKYFH